MPTVNTIRTLRANDVADTLMYYIQRRFGDRGDTTKFRTTIIATAQVLLEAFEGFEDVIDTMAYLEAIEIFTELQMAKLAEYLVQEERAYFTQYIKHYMLYETSLK